MIQQLIKQLAESGEEIYSQVCTVVSINGMNCICQPINGDAEIQDVRLVADDSTEKLVPIPAVGSKVVVAFLNKDAAYVSMVSKITELRYKVGPVEMVIDANGFQFNKGMNSLWSGLKTVIESLEPVVIAQGTNIDKIKLAAGKAVLKSVLNGS